MPIFEIDRRKFVSICGGRQWTDIFRFVFCKWGEALIRKTMKPKATEDILTFDSVFPGLNSMSRLPVRNPHSFYKAALFLTDLLWSILAFGGVAHILFGNSGAVYSIGHWIPMLIFALAAIALFNSCSLYNYHIIYSARNHIKLLATAFGYNALIFIFVFSSVNFADAINKFQIAILTVLVVSILLFARKVAEDFLTQLLTAVGFGFIIVGCLGFCEEDAVFRFLQRYAYVVYGLLITVVVVSVNRLFLVHHLFGKILRRYFRRQTVIVGNNIQAREIAEHIIKTRAPFWIAGVVGPSGMFGKSLSVAKDRLGNLDQLHRIVEEHSVTEVIITQSTIDNRDLIAILDYCASRRINVWFPAGYLPGISVKLVISQFCGLSMIRLGTQKNFWIFNKLKYSFDALATLPIFLVQLPLFLVIAAAVKFTSRGPVFYRATAIGKGGRPFTMYKFRSMYLGCDTTVHKDYVHKLIKGEIYSDGTSDKVLKITEDDRITPVGRIIRKFSLDELPQLINVLKGDMSLVGPRPCLPYEFEAYEDWHKKRVAIRPGISGLWQVTGRSEVTFDEMILLDLYYIYNCGFFMDLSILFETVFVVLQKKGAY